MRVMSFLDTAIEEDNFRSTEGFASQLVSPVAVSDAEAALRCTDKQDVDAAARLRRARSKGILMGLAARSLTPSNTSPSLSSDDPMGDSERDDLPLIMFALSGLKDVQSSPHFKPAMGQERSIKQMHNLATKSDTNKQLILRARGVELVVDVLKQNPMQWSLQEQGLSLLSELARDQKKARDEFVAINGLDIPFLYSSGRYGELEVPASLLCNVFGLMATLARDSHGLQNMIADLGGFDHAVDAMSHCDVVVQTNACLLLRQMVHMNQKRQRALGVRNGVALLFDILRCGQTSTEDIVTLALVSEGAGLIAALVAENDHFIETVGCSGGIALLAKVMQAQRRKASVLNQCCVALRYLAFSEENRPKIGKDGALVCIAEAIVTLQQQPKFVENGLLALSNATFEASDNKYIAGIAGGLDATVCVMKMYPDCPSLLEAACRVLRNLSEWLATTCYQLLTDALEMTLSVMEDHEMHSGIQEHACAVLVNLLKLGVNDVISSRTERLVDSCIETFAKDDLVRNQAIELHHLVLDAKYKASLKKSSRLIFSDRSRS